MSTSAVAWPYLTADLPGMGGRLKVELEDFVVEEIPAYLPCGEGEHLFLWIEKRDLTTEALVRSIVQVTRARREEIGTAGLKDRRGVTRQYVSLPARYAELVPQLENACIRVLSATRHRHKLRTGHLRGNRFEIVVREVVPDAAARAEAIAARLLRHGVPQYFGEQRFGREGETEQTGLALLRGERTPLDLPPSQRRFLLRLSLSAAQSGLFNRLLAERIASGRLGAVEAGDVLQVVASGGVFRCTDPAADQPRYERHEVVPAGPLFGPKMLAAGGDVADREAACLAAAGLTPAHFETYRQLTCGGRRAYVVWPGELEIEPVSAGLRFRLTLPPGSYATVVLREFQKLGDLPDDEAVPAAGESA